MMLGDVGSMFYFGMKNCKPDEMTDSVLMIAIEILSGSTGKR
jgi:hypothetical protein